MPKIFCLLALVVAVPGSSPAAAGVAAMIGAQGFIGAWAEDCAQEVGGFRLTIAAAPDGGATLTTVSRDAGVTTTVRSVVLSAQPVGAGQLRLRLRIVGGDRDGWPLPSPTTNTFDQTLERLDTGHIGVIGTAARRLARCRE